MGPSQELDSFFFFFYLSTVSLLCQFQEDSNLICLLPTEQFRRCLAHSGAQRALVKCTHGPKDGSMAPLSASQLMSVTRPKLLPVSVLCRVSPLS